MVTKLIKFSAAWCQPCKVFAKTFEKVADMEEYKGIEFKSIDIEEDEDGEILAEKFQVRSVPTVVILDENDEQIYKLSGNLSLKDFTDILNNAIGEKDEQ